jgi:hypothetical protein
LQAHRVLTTTSFALLCLSFLRITNLPCATQTLTRSLFLHINGIFENFTRVTKILQTYKMSNFAQKPRHDLLVHQESNSRTYLERIRIGFARGYEFKRCAACAQEQDLSSTQLREKMVGGRDLALLLCLTFLPFAIYSQSLPNLPLPDLPQSFSVMVESNYLLGQEANSTTYSFGYYDYAHNRFRIEEHTQTSAIVYIVLPDQVRILLVK